MTFSDLSSVIGEIVAVQAEPYLTTGQTAASAVPGPTVRPVCVRLAPDHSAKLDELGERLEVAMRRVDEAWAPFARGFR